MIVTVSAICCTSLRMWLETRTVLPRRARLRSIVRISWMPAGSRPLVGSSKISRSGFFSSVAAIARRCFMPSEYLPNLSPLRRPRPNFFEHGVNSTPRRPNRTRHQQKVLLSRKGRKELGLLDDGADPVDDLIDGQWDLAVEDSNVARVCSDQSQKHPDRRGLA